MSYQETRLININSSNAIKNNGTYNSDVYFTFTGLLKDKPNLEKVELAVQYAQIPYSFYNINVYNHHLRISVDYGPHITLQFTRGNYNTSQLITEITNQFNLNGISDVTITIDSITGLLTFTKASGNLEILHTLSTCYKVLGFKPETNYSGLTITAPYPLNLLGTLRLRIISNELFVSTYDSTTQNNFGVLATVPINAGNFGLIDYNNFSNIKSELQSKDLNGFDIRIIDDDNNLINFNGIDWTITIVLTLTFRNTDEIKTLNNVVEQILTVTPQNQNPEDAQPPPQQENNIDFLNNDLDLLIYNNKLSNI